MRPSGLTLVFFAAASAAAAIEPHGSEPPPSVVLPADLQRVLTDYETARGNRDAASLAGLFAEDGFVLPRGGPPVRGRAAIERRYAGSGRSLALRAFAFAAEGTVGYILGGYAPKRRSPTRASSRRRSAGAATESGSWCPTWTPRTGRARDSRAPSRRWPLTLSRNL